MKSLGSDKSAAKAEKSTSTVTASDGDKNGFITANKKIDFSNVKVEPLFEEEVDFDTFSKSDFRAVKVKECVAVPKSKKLLCSQVKMGSEVRQIVSGISQYYKPEEMVGKKVIVVANLKPAKLAGVLSEGMLLCAENEKGEYVLLATECDVPNGVEVG